MQHRTHHTAEMEQCIQNCLNCHHICLETVTASLQHGGEHAQANHIRLMLDCSEICQISANFMIRGSELHALTCGVCAEVCTRCADDCDRFDEAFMKECAEMCRRCAESCQQMAA